MLRSWVKASFRRGYWRAFSQWIKDLLRDPTPNRARRFGQACVMVAELPKDATRLHAHFLHTPASATYYAHLITGMRWSCSAHAKDIWTSPDWDKREKLATLDWLVTCTRDGYEHLREIAGPADRDKINLVYHGLDFERFPEPPLHRRDLKGPLRILSVGRAVPKKGYADLLQALALLPKEVDWRFHHIGGGPLLDNLKSSGGDFADRGLHHLAGLGAAGNGARGLSRGRYLRAGELHRRGWRPRRPAERADGSAEPEAGGGRDQPARYRGAGGAGRDRPAGAAGRAGEPVRRTAAPDARSRAARCAWRKRATSACAPNLRWSAASTIWNAGSRRTDRMRKRSTIAHSLLRHGRTWSDHPRVFDAQGCASGSKLVGWSCQARP